LYRFQELLLYTSMHTSAHELADVANPAPNLRPPVTLGGFLLLASNYANANAVRARRADQGGLRAA
jgi:hypothetical protein